MEPTITAKIIVRHSALCRDKANGSEWRRCKCRKSLLVYEGNGTGSNKRIKTGTRSWEKAEAFQKQWLLEHSLPYLEMKKMRAEEEQKRAKAANQVTIAHAVALYTQDMITRLGDNGSVSMARALLGDVDKDTKAVLKNGHLFNWLDKYNSAQPEDDRLTCISQITATHLSEWRNSWTFGSDLTKWNRWKQVRGFFKFCEIQDWTKQNGNPAIKLPSLEKKEGHRTAIFSDPQYEAILAAIPKYEPAAEQKRLRAFLELLRWTGMDIGDGVAYSPDKLKEGGVLQYSRIKTSKFGTIPLPPHVLELLHDNPSFRTKDALPETDIRKWDRALRKLFKLAGIESVRTEMGKIKKPHVKMLRDTFAVWHIRHGAQLRTVSKMLGHADTSTTERSYLPFVREMEEAHIADGRKALENGKAGKRTKKSS